MVKASQYDAAIIGAGQAGGPLAGALAGAGWRVALIERAHVGGTCVNEGCTPTKTMIASSRSAYVAGRSHDLGVQVSAVGVDMKRVRARKREIVEQFRSGSARRLEQVDGLDLIMGTGRFADTNGIEVESNDGQNREIRADRIFVNTGLRPRIPELDGLDRVPYLDSTSIMELDSIPSHLLILGGGYIGVEFGQMFRRFGSDVTIVQRGKQLLVREDEDVAEEVAEILREEGIHVLLGTEALRVATDVDDAIELSVEGPDGEQALTGSHLLVAVGRTPNTEDLNLPAAGIETDERGFISTDVRLRTSVPGIYALGDVKGGPAFTHIAYDDYRIVRANLLDGGNATTEDRLVPYAVFMDPQLGGIGLTERQAERAGKPVRVAKMPMSYVARALEMDEARGLMKALVDVETDRIVGAAILGIEGGEVMSILQMAMMGQLPYTDLRDAVFAHPSIAESLNTLFSMI